MGERPAITDPADKALNESKPYDYNIFTSDLPKIESITDIHGDTITGPASMDPSYMWVYSIKGVEYLKNLKSFTANRSGVRGDVDFSQNFELERCILGITQLRV